MILGIDVSALQGTVDWSRVAMSGVKFAYLKCSEGNEHRRNDSRYPLNVVGCKAAQILPGAYHFAYPLQNTGNDPRVQARRAYAVSDGLGSQPGELPPALDIEWPPPNQWAKWSVTGQSVAHWTRAYLEEAEKLWGRRPILYTYPWFWTSIGTAAAGFEAYRLWIADYKYPRASMPPEGAKPMVPWPWTDWTIWQFSANGGKRVDGISTDVDRNVFHGTLEDLRAFAGCPVSCPDPSPPELNWSDKRTLQRALLQLGFDPGPIDGIHGPRTLAAVRSYQNARGLKPDAIAGPITRAAIERDVSALPAAR